LLATAALPRAASGDPYSIVLVWTAPGDDADVGRATRYELRFSTSSVGADIAEWWGSANAAASLPTPSSSGQPDSTVVRGLHPGVTYYFVLRSIDDAGNPSPFSNVAAATTDSTAGVPGGSATPASPAAAIHAYPNPSTDAVHFVIHVEDPAGERVRIRLFDLSGRVIADIADGSFPSGNTVISWPRVTRNGDRVAPGYYESIGTIGEGSVRERLILLP
jgi:hypothetical protein